MKTIAWKLCTTVALALIAAGCGREPVPHQTSSQPEAAAPAELGRDVDPLALALAPHEGDSATDREIRRFQDRVREGRNRDASLERLGWLFVAKARESFDPGYYKLAEACAGALDADSPGGVEALLLRGHVLQNLHRFKDAEVLAHELIAKRGLSFDYGLLGDTLMEQGRLDEAVSAYQHMVDLRPDLQSYSRIAHLRWLKGDLDGAVEMMQAAVRSSSALDADSAAWVNTRLAVLQFQSGASADAQRACASALELRTNYPPALLLCGRMLLARRDSDAAVESLRQAAQLNPLPEYEWALAEALRAAGDNDEAVEVEAGLRARGEMNDPRTLALFLATRGEQVETAVRLAEAELQQRQDVNTRDAYAWALAAAGRLDEAQGQMAAALSEGTEDARLFFHAAAIASRSSHASEASKWFTRAARLMPLLLPSEQKQLIELADSLADNGHNAGDSLPQTAATALSTSAH